jgi:hypothetical protein
MDEAERILSYDRRRSTDVHYYHRALARRDSHESCAKAMEMTATFWITVPI